MLRLRMWTRIGLLALVLAMGTAWVTIAASPAFATTTSGGSKTTDPGGDPGVGGGSSVGDPDGPGGDIAPSAGTLHGGGAFGTGVQPPTVMVAGPAQNLPFWTRLKIALGMVVRAMILRL